MTSFGARFKQLRKELDITQMELATVMNDKYGYSFGKSSISSYENDKRTPELGALKNFAEYFNVSLDYLLGVSDIKNPEVEIYAQAFHSISTEELTQEEIDLLENMIEQFKKNRGIRK